MASRMKKIFHRKKDEGSEGPPQRTRAPATASTDPAIRTSLYESTTAGGLPQTGDYPIKGNDSSVILRADRKSSVRSIRSRRSSSRGSQLNTPYQAPTPNQSDVVRKTPRMSQSPSHANIPGSYNPYNSHQHPPSTMSGQDAQRNSSSRTPLSQEFAGLNLGTGQGSTTVTSTVTTTRFGQQAPNVNQGNPRRQYPYAGQQFPESGATSRNIEPQSPYANRGVTQTQGNGTKNNYPGYGSSQDTQPSSPYTNRSTPRYQDSANPDWNAASRPAHMETNPPDSYAERGNDSLNSGSPRMVHDGAYRQSAPSTPYRNGISSNTRSNEPNTSISRDGYQDLARQKSISRKQVGTPTHAPYSPVQPSTSSSPQLSHNQHQSDSKPLPFVPTSSNDGYGDHGTPVLSQPSSILDRSRPITKGYAAPRDGKDVVDRAKSNTYDTEVIEKIAPAVVHENVTKDVHHIREEVITREIHTHDVYHRILPIVDVEVLPPRHFLPVEGGGLVEVSAAEVPGRGHNWVIAETASKIPSDQAAPQGRRRFTARTFPGQEGDTVKYITPDGYEKTEETWVHPPELEEGARLTGQSWPMVFGDDNASNSSYADPTPNQSSRKSPKKGQAAQASPAQRAGGFGRMAQSPQV